MLREETRKRERRERERVTVEGERIWERKFLFVPVIKNGGEGEGENVKVVTFLYAFYVIRFILHKLFLSQNSQKNGP